MEALQVQLLNHRHHHAHRMAGAYKIVGTLDHHRYLTTLWAPQTYRCLEPVRFHFAHVLLINCIDLENLLQVPERIEKVTGSQGGRRSYNQPR